MIVGLLRAQRRKPTRSWLDPAAAYLGFPFAAAPRRGGVRHREVVVGIVPILWLAITGTSHELWTASGLAVIIFIGPAR